MNAKNVKKNKWSADIQPDKAVLLKIMADERLNPYTWSNGPGDVYSAHNHSYHKVIYVVSGSITFGLPEKGDSVYLQTGDRLDLPAGVVQDAVVGPQGVVCLEAHR
jgi:quercetin dioxygenase-like cupin family protein